MYLFMWVNISWYLCVFKFPQMNNNYFKLEDQFVFLCAQFTFFFRKEMNFLFFYFTINKSRLFNWNENKIRKYHMIYEYKLQLNCIIIMIEIDKLKSIYT